MKKLSERVHISEASPGVVEEIRKLESELVAMTKRVEAAETEIVESETKLDAMAERQESAERNLESLTIRYSAEHGRAESAEKQLKAVKELDWEQIEAWAIGHRDALIGTDHFDKAQEHLEKIRVLRG